jgi:7-carboxy-7-deazaguanine synthase
MLQRDLPALAEELVGRGYEVAVETHGQRPLDALPPSVIRIVDVKTPGSGETTRDFGYLDRLMPHDEVKFVVCSEEDFRWSADVIRRHRLEERSHVLLSPAWGRVEPRDLARWLLESGLDARLSLQIHKLVWGPDVRGV